MVGGLLEWSIPGSRFEISKYRNQNQKQKQNQMSDKKKEITLSVEDISCVRASIRAARNAVCGRGNLVEMKKAGFSSLVASIMGDVMKKLQNENEALIRFAAWLANKVAFEILAQQGQLCTFCLAAGVDDSAAVAVPCGHCSSCASCATFDKCSACPICRAPVERMGSKSDVETVFYAGMDDSLAPMTKVVMPGKKKDHVDMCVIIKEEDDIKAVLKEYAEGEEGMVPSLMDLFTNAPSLAWSLCLLSKAADGKDLVGDPEARVNALIHRLLGVPLTVNKRKRK